jgi:hypothetical protein
VCAGDAISVSKIIDRVACFLTIYVPRCIPESPNICPIFFLKSERLIDATSILRARNAIGIEACNRSAHCEGINESQPRTLGIFLLLAAPTRSAHGSAGATGSVRYKRNRRNLDIDKCDRVKISRSDEYRPLRLFTGCDCVIEEGVARPVLR